MDWRLLIILIGALLVIVTLAISWFGSKTPPIIREFVNYFNLHKYQGEITDLLHYSQYFSHLPQINWQYFYGGKREGKELYFGLFDQAGVNFTFFLLADEVRPMIISSSDQKYNWPEQRPIHINGQIYTITAPETYIIDNLVKSNDLLISLSDLFQGQVNCLEFTELNQIIFITDYQFADNRQLIEIFSQFFKLKEKI
ncbi:MAG: hypothetical protein WC570_00700 [Patescibacteria group bacterium]